VFVICGFEQIILKDMGLGLFPDSIIIGTVIRCRYILAIVVYAAGLLIFIREKEKSLLYIYLILGSQLFMYSLYCLKQWFQVKTLNKYVMISSLCSFAYITVAKIVFLVFGFGIFTYSVFLATGTLAEVILLVFFFNNKSNVKFLGRFDVQYCKHLFRSSFPLLLQGFTIMIFMKIDQIMIGNMLPKQELGIYSIGVIISEMIYFVPMSVINGLYPKIVMAEKEGNSNNLLIKIGSINLIICFCFALACTFFVPYFVELFYGHDYAGVGQIVKIHSWAGVFVAIAVSQSPLVVFRNLQKHALYGAVLGAVLNICLNSFMIKIWGIKGAAIATLITQIVTSYLYYAFLKDKTFFINETKSIFFVFRKLF
jgi:O-antigen/teichoic acid export membrane protein